MRYKEFKCEQGVAEGSEDPSWKKGWELCDKEPSDDPEFLFRKHGAGLNRGQFIQGFNANAKSRGIKQYGDTGSSVDHGELRYKEFKREQGVAEGIGGDMAKLIGIPVVAGAAAIGAQYYDDQQPHVQVGGQNAKIVRADSTRIPANAVIITGKDGKQYRV